MGGSSGITWDSVEALGAALGAVLSPRRGARRLLHGARGLLETSAVFNAFSTRTRWEFLGLLVVKPGISPEIPSEIQGVDQVKSICFSSVKPGG